MLSAQNSCEEETNYMIYFWLKGLTRLWHTLTCEHVKSVNVYIYADNGHLFLLFHYLNALRKELLVFLVSVFLLLLVQTKWLNRLNSRSFPPKEMCFLCLWLDGWFTQTICDLSGEPHTRSVNKTHFIGTSKPKQSRVQQNWGELLGLRIKLSAYVVLLLAFLMKGRWSSSPKVQ